MMDSISVDECFNLTAILKHEAQFKLAKFLAAVLTRLGSGESDKQ